MKLIKRVLLINPPINIDKVYGNVADFSSVTAPVWACYIAALLRKEGYVVSILDAEAERLDIDTTVKKAIEWNPDLIGFSCMTSKIAYAYKVAKIIKMRMPDVSIIAGGAHISAIPDRTLDEFPDFDILVVGEGEITCKELISALNSGSDLKQVEGIAFKDKLGNKIHTLSRKRIKELDNLPSPAYDLLPELKTHYWPYFNNIQGYPAFSLISSRGCPHQCNFCDRKVFGNIFTKHSPKYFVNIIEDMINKYGIRYLVFDDDNILLDRKYLFGILDELFARKIRIPFTCESRVDTVDEEKLERLRDSGCKEIMYGIESGSPRILKLMNKGITVDQVRHAIKLTKKYKISALGYFMLGYPGETEQSMQETVDFIKELKLFDIAAQPFVPFPGTDIYKHAIQNGNLEEDWEKIGNFSEMAYTPHGLSKEMIAKYLNKCYGVCYNNMRTYLTLYKRVHSWKHFKILIKLMSSSKNIFSE